MNTRTLLFLCLSASLASAQVRIPDFPSITGSAVDKNTDLLWLNDTSQGNNSTASKKITIAELVNIPGLFASVPNATFTISKLAQSGATSGQVPTWNGTEWSAATPSWGGISGTLSNQTDLTLALSDKQTRTWDGIVLPRTKRRLAAEAVAGSVRPFRVKHLVMGDSYAVQLSEFLETQVAPLREQGFGQTVTIAGSVSTDLSQWTRSPNGGTVWRLTGSGQSVQHGGATDIESYRIKVYYQTESGGGTFAVETNTSSGGWTEVPTATTASPVSTDASLGTGATATATVSGGAITGITVTNGGSGYVSGNVGVSITGAGSGAMATATVSGGAITAITVVRGGTGYTSPTITVQGIGCGVFAYDYTTAEPRRVRAKWISGTVRILGFVLSDIREDVANPRGGSGEYNLAIGGQNLQDWAQCPQNIWNTIIRDIEPDFVSLKGDDSNWTGVCGTASTDLYQKLQTARDMDWIFIGRHPASASQYAGQGPNSGNELLSMDTEMRDFALSHDQLWINPRRIFPSYSVMQGVSVIAGATATNPLIAGDNTHLSPYGGYYQGQAIMSVLSRELVESWKIHKGSTQTFAAIPRYASNALGVILPAGAQSGLEIGGRTNSTAGYGWRKYLTLSKLDDNGAVGIHVGRYDEARIITDTIGRWFINNGTGGFGNGLVAFPRYPSGCVEIHSGNRTTTPLLSLSGASGFSGDMFRLYSGAGITTGTEGTIVTKIDISGNATFSGKVSASIPAYANDAAADADSALLSGQLYKITGSRAVYQKP